MNTPFTPEFFTEIRTILETQQERLTHQLAEMKDKETGSSFPNYGEGEDEDAEEVAAYDANLQLVNTLETELRDTIDSLVRIEKGTYGTCKYCHNPIDEQRLRARVTSSSCVACKKALTQEV